MHEKRRLTFILLLRPSFESSIARQVVPPQAKQINHQYDFQGDAFKKDITSKPQSPPSEEPE
jgi:hypothetical protein